MKRWTIVASLLLALLAAAGAVAFAQEPTETKPAEPADVHGRLLLVLPFENRSGVGNLDWVSEAFPDILNRRLNSAGFLTIGRGDRLYAFDHLGLPGNLEPTRATAIRIAQMLDADYVIFGHYALGGQEKSAPDATAPTGTAPAGHPINNQVQATAEILDVTGLKLGPPLAESGTMDRLPDMVNRLAWQVTRQIDPTYGVEEQTFVAADRDLPEGAFQDYLQGVVGESTEQDIGDLRDAVKLDPQFAPALLALGRAYFSHQDYDQAAATLGRIPQDNRNALEAEFYRGLAFFYTGNYKEAEDAFAFVTNQLPLPEVVNNEGVAESRRSKDAGALFQQAVAADPRDPDYHFNLAVALAHRGDKAAAQKELEETLKLRPQDQEAQQFSAQLKAPPAPDPDPGHAIPDPDQQGPLERIKRGYSEAGFRQAAFELEQVQQMRLASLPPTERAEALVKDGDQFFQRGLVLEAEREYREALAADAGSAMAHAGLAAVRERDGDADAARQEAHASIRLKPNVPAFLVLARLDLQANQLGAAAGDVGDALKVDPANANAKGMKLALAQRGQTTP